MGFFKNQITVYIKQEPIDTTVKRHVDVSSDGTKALVVIEKPTAKKAGWSVDVTGCIRTSTKGMYVEVIRGQTKAIKIDVTNPDYTYSKMTNDEMQQFIDLKIFKAHYGKLMGDLIAALKPWLIIVIVVAVIGCALAGYDAYYQ
jgi:hypothetical protein